MSTTTITDALADQAARQFDMLRATIQRIDDDQWHTGGPRQAPAYIALHALLWAEYYTLAEPKTFNPRGRFGVSDNDPVEALPGRAAILEYVDHVAACTDAFLRGLDEATLFAPEPLFPWTGATVFERTVYTLRHTTYHLGELSFVLRVHGAEQTEWA